MRTKITEDIDVAYGADRGGVLRPRLKRSSTSKRERSALILAIATRGIDLNAAPYNRRRKEGEEMIKR